ncbi:MAG: hypothetical protein LUI87_13645 [Lachnospiraceae bacterium]|nr:hypothetical protein [Lachnospiraceae bacterium]
MDMWENTLERYLFLALMQKEFGIAIDKDDLEQAAALRNCIHIYDTWQVFYGATGWERDNPELAYPEYLITNRICREIHGKIWHFSWIDWEAEVIG